MKKQIYFQCYLINQDEYWEQFDVLFSISKRLFYIANPVIIHDSVTVAIKMPWIYNRFMEMIQSKITSN